MRIIVFSLLLILQAFPQNNYSLSYDGGDYLRKATTAYRGTDEQGTFSFWILPETINDFDHVLSVLNQTTFTAELAIQVMSTLKVRIEWANTGTKDIVESNGTLNTGLWNHVLCKSNGSGYIIIINGINQSLSIQSGSNSGNWFADITAATTNNFVIGASGRATPVANIGAKIDELAYFNIATNNATDLQLYNNGKPKDISSLQNLTDYWRFENGSGISAVPTVGSLTFPFGDGSTSTTFPSWSSDTPGWDASNNLIYQGKRFKKYDGLKNY